MSNRRSVKRKNEDLTEDMKNDLYLGFNLMKNNRDKLSKLKLRSLLFNFAMYKSSPSDINEFINEHYPKQDEFSFDELKNLVFIKYALIKEREAEDTWCLLTSSKQSTASKHDLSKAFHSVGIEMNDKEVSELVEFIREHNEDSYDKMDSDIFTKEDFKSFINS